MPSKARTEPKKSSKVLTSTVAVPKSLSDADGKGGAVVEAPLERWIFELEKPTIAAFRCGIGDQVDGSRSGQGIAVTQPEKGSLGYAPPPEAVQMLNALRRGSLVGQIIAEGNSSRRKSPLIEMWVVER